MANMIARLGVVLGLDSAEFVRGIDKASKKLDELSVAATKYAAVAAAALTASSIAALKFADEMVDVAKANDMAVDSIVKLSNALSLSGGSSQDAGKLLASFTNFVDKAASGSFEAQKSFAKLGIGLKDLGQLSSTELFEKTIQALAEIEDPITRNAKAMEILGKAAKGVDITELLTQMQEGKTLADEQAKAIENAAEIYDMITKSGQQFMLMLTTQLGPPLKATIEYFKELKGAGNDLGPILGMAFQSIAIVAGNLAFVIKTIVQDVIALGRAAGAIVTGDFAKVSEIYREAVARAEKDRANLDQFERRVLGTGDGRRGLDDPRIVGRGRGPTGRATIEGKNPEAEKAAREELARLARLKKLQEELMIKQQEAAEKERIAMDEHSDRMQKNGIELQKAQRIEAGSIALQKQLLEVEVNRNRLLPEQIEFQRQQLILEYQHRQNLEAINDTLLTKEEKQKRIAAETENYYARLEVARQRLDQTLSKRQGSFEQGFIGKMQDFFRDMPTQLEYGAQAFDSVMGNMTRAMDSFVRTGKLSFKDLARSIIQDLIRIQLQAQMTSIFKTLVGFIFPSSGGLTTGDFARMDRARADGGPVAGSTPYLVGERGPELFVPRSSGTIVPNHALGMGGTTNVTNNYIQAIDVQSFEQRLLGSSNAIWAANQYAQKSLATGRGRT